jgi:lipopolysaccharide assembly outer membrane protein LptD (OstA)
LRKAVVFGLFFFAISAVRAAEPAAAVSTPAPHVDVSTATGQTITYDSKTGLAVIEGNAVVMNSTATLKADKIQLNVKQKMGRADGHVEVIQSSGTLTGTHADYNWATATGTVDTANGVGEPWRFDARQLTVLPNKDYELTDAEVTSCDLNPPHYKIEAKHGVVRPGKRLTLYNADLALGDTPSLWLPVYTKSLVPKKYRLSIEPGSSSRDGFTNKTIFGYPYTKNSWTDLRWDYLERTGDGAGVNHRYFAPNVKGDLDAYYIRDSNPDPEIPRSKRYTFLWDHYQKLTSRLTMNAHTDIKSDQSFGNSFSNAGNGVLVENQQRGLLSNGGFTYQLPKATFEAQFARSEKFDTTVSSRQFISQVTLPRMSMNTAPFIWKKFPVYTTFNGSFVNQTQTRYSPLYNLYYQREAVGGVNFRKDLRIKKITTITPIVGYSETWDNRVLTSSGVATEKDQYVGRYTLGADVKRNINRNVSTTWRYRYGIRFASNETKPDATADDHGVETNQLTGDVTTRIGRNTLITLASGYDYRNDPLSLPGRYRHVSARVIDPTVDVQWEIKPRLNLFFRETYQLFDPYTLTQVNTPANTSAEIQWGDPMATTFFSQGFSYSKSSPDTPSQLYMNNKLKLYLTRKWYMDLILSYRAQGASGVNYSKVFPIEKTIRLVRDLHCWILRMEFTQRPDRTDASFFIDLKASAGANKELFDKSRQQNYRQSTRNDGPQLDQLFPTEE